MILELIEISKSFGEKCILDQINITIKTPRLICLVAPNGSGKTTLMNIISNIEKPDNGWVSIFDQDNANYKIFNHLSYLQDNKILYDDLTGDDHLNFVAGLHGKSLNDIKAITTRLKINLYTSKKVKYYSLGMKQQLLWALALIPDNDLLLLDEPFNGLDPSSIVRNREILLDLFKSGKTIILSSHNLEQIEKISNDIFFLYRGKILHYDDVKKDNRIDYQVVIDNLKDFNNILENNGIAFQNVSLFKVLFKATHLEYEQIAFEATKKNIRIFDKVSEEENLEKLYLNLYEDYKYDS